MRISPYKLTALGIGWLSWLSLAVAMGAVNDPAFQRVEYNNPGLVADLAVGLWAWPMPMDWDGDGDLDLVVSCPDVPYNGTYLFENPGPPGNKQPIFKPPVRVGPGLDNVQVSFIGGGPRVLTPAVEWKNFLGGKFADNAPIYPRTNIHANKVRENQWRYVDYDGDGAVDLIVGVADWTDYGWDKAFDKSGKWTHGPLHGYVYLLKNVGTGSERKYAEPVKVEAARLPADVFGRPSPNFADFDGDGDLDLLCGEFLDGFTYFENIGTRREPRYAAGRRLSCNGKPLKMHLQMITPTAIDWDGDGDVDLIVGDEDGRVAFVENTGRVVDGLPEFAEPRYFQQQAQDVKFGALVTPVSADWDNDGDEDLICGNSAGEIGFIENLDGGNLPKWVAPVKLRAGDDVIRIQAGANGSIQGPAEAKWGYTSPCVADWDHDGRLDLIVNSIWGRIVVYRNIGTSRVPKLAPAQPIDVDWPDRSPYPAWNWWRPTGHELITQWRTTPAVIDWNADKLNDLLMIDHEGYLTVFLRRQNGASLTLSPGQRAFLGKTYGPQNEVLSDQLGQLRLNAESAGRSGRRKFCVVDWDNDGRLDLLVNSENVNFLRNIPAADSSSLVTFDDRGPVSKQPLAGHSTSPTTVDWDGDGIRDLLVGAEDGHLYYLRNPHREKPHATSQPSFRTQR